MTSDEKHDRLADARDAQPPEQRRATRPPTAPLPPSRWRRWAFDLVLLAGVYAAISAWQERHLLDTHAFAPDVELEALDGTHVSLDGLHGKRVLVHFWATWCGVCRQEFGALNAVHATLAPDEAMVAVVADSDDPEQVRRFVEEEHLKYPVLLGTPDVLQAFRVSAFPTNYFLDKTGRITGHTVGMSTRWSIRARLALAN